jgi:hypothetical protein
LNPEPAAEPFPLLCAGGATPTSPGGLPDPFPPFGAVPLSKDEGFVVGCGAVAAGSVSETNSTVVLQGGASENDSESDNLAECDSK